MARSFPSGRIGLRQLLTDASLSKNTFLRRYRNDPAVAVLLDIAEDRDHRLHFPVEAGEVLKRLHGKGAHGNRGRKPQRPCPECSAPLHPCHRACNECGHVLVSDEVAGSRPKGSTAERNFKRRDDLRQLKDPTRVE